MTGVVLTGLYVYPIKSCRGMPLRSAGLTATGLRHDRRWMLVDEGGRFMSQRAHPRMALISPRTAPGRLVVTAPGMPDLEVPLEDASGERLDVEIWGDRQRAVPAGYEADRWFGRFLGVPCRLVRKPEDDVRPVDSTHATAEDQAAFSDRFPLLLVSEASLEDLNGRLESPVPMERFRPNLVVAGCGPYAEDRWGEIRIGGASFRVAEPCARCSITITDQKTGERGREPLKTLATYRKAGGKVWFGRNLLHSSRATVRLGDAVETVPR